MRNYGGIIFRGNKILQRLDPLIQIGTVDALTRYSDEHLIVSKYALDTARK